jgi:hypothetical protein
VRKIILAVPALLAISGMAFSEDVKCDGMIEVDALWSAAQKECGIGRTSAGRDFSGYAKQCAPAGSATRSRKNSARSAARASRLNLPGRRKTGRAPTFSRTIPKGTDMSVSSQAHLNKVARQLNVRPREILGFETPAARFNTGVA